MSQAPRDIRNYVQKKLEELGIDPVEELVELYNSGNLADKERRAIMQELLKYCAPQLKAMDIRAQLKGDIKVNIVNFDPADAIPMAEAPVEAEA